MNLENWIGNCTLLGEVCEEGSSHLNEVTCGHLEDQIHPKKESSSSDPSVRSSSVVAKRNLCAKKSFS